MEKLKSYMNQFGIKDPQIKNNPSKEKNNLKQHNLVDQNEKIIENTNGNIKKKLSKMIFSIQNYLKIISNI